MRQRDAEAGISSQVLTDEQKAAIAEVRSLYNAKIAEQDILQESAVRRLYGRITSYNVCYTKLLRLSLEVRVGGTIHLPHTASAKLPGDFIRAEASARGQRHR